MEHLLGLNIDLFEKIKVIEFIKNWSDKHIENIFELIKRFKWKINDYGNFWNNYYLFLDELEKFNFAISTELIRLGNDLKGTKEEAPYTNGKMRFINFGKIFVIIWDIHNKMIEQKEI